MSQQLSMTIAVIGVDIGKNSFHIVGLDQRGAIVLSRGQVESRFANMPPCLAIELGAPRAQAMARGGQEAAAPQRARHRSRQQAGAHRLERSCPWPEFRGNENHSSRPMSTR
jgi:hypothetical protein